MATKNFKLRIQYNNETYDIDSLTNENTIGDLKALLWSLTTVHPDCCQLLIGFPRKILNCNNEQPIGEVIQNSRETLIMKKISLIGNC